MQSNILFAFALCTILLAGCTSTKRIPPIDTVGTYTYGAHIYVRSPAKVKGELIVVDSTQIAVLVTDADGSRVVTVSAAKVTEYYVQYAKTPDYTWTIPVYILSSVMHGFFGVISLPMNAITTGIVEGSSNQAYRHSHKDLSYDELYRFARFPQGLPRGVQLSDIR